MQKLPRSQTKNVDPVQLYLDDFLNIVKLLKENCKSVEVELDGYQLESCSEEELAELRERLPAPFVHEIDIRGRSPRIWLRLQKEFRELDISDADDLLSIGLAEKIVASMPRRRFVQFCKKASGWCLASVVV
ncbi:MAG: hypothetical protein WBY44_16030, partial [Bryobacteraceae bacterium]